MNIVQKNSSINQKNTPQQKNNNNRVKGMCCSGGFRCWTWHIHTVVVVAVKAIIIIINHSRKIHTLYHTAIHIKKIWFCFVSLLVVVVLLLPWLYIPIHFLFFICSLFLLLSAKLQVCVSWFCNSILFACACNLLAESIDSKKRCIVVVVAVVAC